MKRIWPTKRIRFWALALAVAINIAALVYQMLPPLPQPEPPAALAAGTFTVAVPPTTAVTMGDVSATIPFTVTNTGASGNIDELEFRFDARVYYVSGSTTAPSGWEVSSIANAGTGRARIIFAQTVSGSPIGPGQYLVFNIDVVGTGYATFPNEASDQTDTMDDVRARGSTTFVLSGGLPSWARKGLAVSLTASPSSTSVGSGIRVNMTVSNRSTATQNSIVPATLIISGTGGVTVNTGPIPSSLSLATLTSASITWTLTTTSTGTVIFSNSASNGTVTSMTKDSNSVLIGNFTVSLSLTPDVVISGQTITVTMVAQNNGSVALGNVTPYTLTLLGTATMTWVSGPTPASVPSVGPGSSTTFEWVYAITGSVAQTYSVSGYATATGPLTSNTATSNAGAISVYAVLVSPDAVTAGSTNVTFSFTVYNNGGLYVDRVRIQTPDTAFVYSSASGGYNGNWRVTTGGGTPTLVTFTPYNPGQRLPTGQSATFYITYSSVPNPVVDTPYNFSVEIRDADNNLVTLNAGVTITKYRVTVTAVPSSGIPADGNSTSIITATVTQGGSPVVGVTVGFETTRGSLSSSTAQTDSAGKAVVTLTAPVSQIAVQSLVTASYSGASGDVLVSFTGVVGGNPLYMGGTLSPLEMDPGDSVSFSLAVQNVGNAAITVTTSSYFTFTDSINLYKSYLTSQAIISPSQQVTLTFEYTNVASLALAGSYTPYLYLTDGGVNIFVRTVSDFVVVRLVQFYDIVSTTGSTTIRARVRLGTNGAVTVLWWRIE